MADDARAKRDGARLLDRVYRAVESSDYETVRSVCRPDAFLFTPTADGVLSSADAITADVRRWSEAVAGCGASLRIRTESSLVGASDSGEGLWVFDEVAADLLRAGTVSGSLPIRVTALLARDDHEWRIAAGYWSMPYRTQAEQDAVNHAGQLLPGVELEEAITVEGGPLVDALLAVLDRPRLLPGRCSARDDHVTIGSVTDEVFVGAAGRDMWEEFVRGGSTFVPRGPMRAALVGPDIGWLAANIDIGDPATAYRFLYVWTRESQGWRIAVSHDAVSRDPREAEDSGQRAG